MIQLKVPLSGTDRQGKPFSCGPGELVELDYQSEKNLATKKMAKKVKPK